MHDYLILAYLDDQVQDELVDKKFTERTTKALSHIKKMYFPLYRVTKAIDLLSTGQITEDEFYAAYNKYRSETGCVCREDEEGA